MTEYHKIQTAYLRDPATKYKTLLEGQFALPEFEYLQGNKWVFTEKIDGTCIRIMWDGKAMRFGGKTDRASIPTFLYDKLEDLFSPDKFSIFEPGDDGITQICLYGEGYGAKIQKGGGNYIPDGCGFILFDVKIGEWWLKHEDVEDVANKFGITVVPIIGHGTLQEGIEMVRKGYKSLVGTQTAEGLVMRPATELRTRSGQRIITKIKHKDFN